MGLSPRVRGNHSVVQFGAGPGGSIPACAGEPSGARSTNRIMWVYPRVCGGTSNASSRSTFTMGLSPRVRGNRRIQVVPGRIAGSIPACAGEPCRKATWTSCSRVYPRVCGGTRNVDTYPLAFSGLSPRVRGNRIRHLCQRDRAGSIPACAGEPSRARCRSPASRVYPRVCGGTDHRCAKVYPGEGLSPRVRGNQRALDAGRGNLGSIPACAGEPTKGAKP